MANSYWDVFGDSWLSKNGSTEYGNGVGSRLQSGRSSSGDWDNRFFIGFLRPTSGAYLIPSGATITKATIFLKVRGNPGSACFGQGGSPKVLFRRVTNTAYVPKENAQGDEDGECGLSTAAGSDGTAAWPGPTSTATDQAMWEGTPATGTVISKDITAMFLAWWAARGASDNYFTVTAYPSNTAGTAEELASGRRIAFYSADSGTADPIYEGGYGPYLLVEYSTTTAPNAPTLTAPADGARVTGQYRQLNFTYTHPSGTAGTDYRVQVSTNVGMTALVVDKTVADAMTNNEAVAVTLSQTTDFSPGDETRGTTYYWRVQTKGDGVWSAWSVVRSYVVNRVPTMTHVWPS